MIIPKKTIISLCDLTGAMVEPWVRAGYCAIMIDPQHPEGVTYSHYGLVAKIGHVIDHPLSYELIYREIRAGRVAFVAGFPPCTDVAVSGARWWESKREKDPYFQAKAARVAEQCKSIGELSGAPWFFENPVSAFSGIFGAPTHTFHPYEYTQYAPEDNYTKKTCLWAGSGFVMPPVARDETLGEPDNRIHHCPPGPERQNFRSATPKGFAVAVFLSNQRELIRTCFD